MKLRILLILLIGIFNKYNLAVAAQPEKLITDQSLIVFLQDQVKAALAFNSGDFEYPLSRWLASENVTLFGGAGGTNKSIESIAQRFRRATSRYTEGSEVEIDFISIVSNGNLAYSVQIEKRKTKVDGMPEPIESSLRGTMIMQKVDNEWKVIHRHADPLVEFTPPRFLDN